MSAVWLQLITVLCLSCTALSGSDSNEVVWRNHGESITIQCRSPEPNQDVLVLQKGISADFKVLVSDRNSKNTIASDFKDRLQVNGVFPSMDILIKNLTSEDMGLYWWSYISYNRSSRQTKTEKGTGSVLLVVRDASPQQVTAPITMTLNQPSPKDIFSINQIKLECIITGQDEGIVNGLEITWQIDGQEVTDSISESQVSLGGHHSKKSTMTRSRTEWLRVNTVRCSATGDHMTPVTQDLTVHKGDGRKPKVTVHVPTEQVLQDSGEVTLVCLVSSPVLQDYYIAWTEYIEQGTSTYMDGINFPPQKTQQGYSVTSVYTTTSENWKKYKFVCNVLPAGSNDSMRSVAVPYVNGYSIECDK